MSARLSSGMVVFYLILTGPLTAGITNSVFKPTLKIKAAEILFETNTMKGPKPTLDLPYSDIFSVSVIYLVPVKLLKTHQSLADMLLT